MDLPAPQSPPPALLACPLRLRLTKSTTVSATVVTARVLLNMERRCTTCSTIRHLPTNPLHHLLLQRKLNLRPM
jgi:hypothetical protein